MNPPAQKIQYIFHDTMLSPLGEPHLQDLQNLFGQAFGVQWLIIANHHLPNIGNLTSPQILQDDATPILTFIGDEAMGGINPNPTPH